jgi:hypothetical protein
MPIQHRRGAMAVAVLQLGLVVPDGQQLDALAAAGGGQLGQSFLMAAQLPASSRQTNSRGSSRPPGWVAASSSAL